MKIELKSLDWLFVKVNSCWVWKLTLQIKHYIIKEVPLIPMAPLEVRQYYNIVIGFLYTQIEYRLNFICGQSHSLSILTLCFLTLTHINKIS